MLILLILLFIVIYAFIFIYCWWSLDSGGLKAAMKCDAIRHMWFFSMTQCAEGRWSNAFAFPLPSTRGTRALEEMSFHTTTTWKPPNNLAGKKSLLWNISSVFNQFMQNGEVAGQVPHYWHHFWLWGWKTGKYFKHVFLSFIRTCHAGKTLVCPNNFGHDIITHNTS